jgi:hypothetical protein
MVKGPQGPQSNQTILGTSCRSTKDDAIVVPKNNTNEEMIGTNDQESSRTRSRGQGDKKKDEFACKSESDDEREAI